MLVGLAWKQLKGFLFQCTQRDRNKDKSLINIRNRKVRITNGTSSLYALCGSWLRNSFPEESQPQYGDIAKSLPQPLPMPVTDNLPNKREGVEQEEGVGFPSFAVLIRVKLF
ncbi:hypothetical protein SLEP1_g53832 [Rubroshorea leprosula]|uniref:Uncharacterized protein n=1 Tax=Rubroshorea leprosula TaxID=152421 RepID=A0AAV5MAG4_9ROSI|nr:hypothetical protein SLEP1_g53832 [Rubroshorea leprosula]